MKKKIMVFIAALMSATLFFSMMITASAEEFRIPVTYNGKSYNMYIEDNNALAEETRLRLYQVFEQTYPVMVEKYNVNAPKTVYLRVDTAYDGVAYTVGNNITVSDKWLIDHPYDVDCITHELFHVVQSYPSGNYIYLIEGLTDYARYQFGIYNKEAGWGIGNYNENQKYTDSYTTTARFILWVEKYVNPQFSLQLDDLFYNNQYTPAAWVTLTGKTVEDLWAEYAASPDINRAIGDIDMDGNITVSDVVALRGAIMSGASDRIYDTDFDRKVTVSDIVELRKLIMQ